jgi:hypothetical protein
VNVVRAKSWRWILAQVWSAQPWLHFYSLFNAPTTPEFLDCIQLLCASTARVPH